MSSKSPVKPTEVRLDPADNPRLARLCGALDVNLRQIESALDVTIARRGAKFTVRGEQAKRAAQALEHFYDRATGELTLDDVLLERGTIELAPLAYMRGRTLNHAFIILDEAQNTTPEQMKMFLTRIGFGATAVVNGDVTQTDLARGQKSGLIEARRILDGVRGIAFTQFGAQDVVRHPLVARIIDAYEKHSQQEE